MIKLENVSTTRLIETMYYLATRSEFYKTIYEILVSNNIENFLQLSEFLESGQIKSKWIYEILEDYLNHVTRKMNMANERGLGLAIFTDSNYKKSLIDRETLDLTDRENRGNILLYTPPYVSGGERKVWLGDLTIEEIKYNLSHVDDCYFRSLFVRNRNFGINSVKKIANLVEFYEQQVIRQAMETEERGINLFTLNKKLKDEIVRAEIKYIAEYLVDNAREFIWGKVSDFQKKRMVECASSLWGKNMKQDRNALVNAISNYTTLSELEEGVIKKRTLDRFIVR